MALKRFAAARRRFFRPRVEALEERSLLAAVITVNSTADTNARDTLLTLREAILVNNRTLTVASLSAAEQAQVSGTPSSTDADTINFAIPGTGVQTISPTAALPPITDRVTINGYSQPGAATNSNSLSQGLNTVLRVELTGNVAGDGAIGLLLGNGSSGSTIRGLAINRFSAEAIRVESDSNTIAGNFLGTDVTGTAAQGNGVGIGLRSSNNLIGGVLALDRNLISGNGSGVSIVLASGNAIRGNYIGTNAEGSAALGNTTAGVEISEGSVNTIIGLVPGAGNVISGNGEGIRVGINSVSGPNGTEIQGNLVGTDSSGRFDVGNLGAGIHVGKAHTTHIGGTSAELSNIISGNDGVGVQFDEGATLPTVLGNYIGTQVDGRSPLGNGSHGILVGNNVDNLQVGGSASDNTNTIAYNGGDGIFVSSTLSTVNSLYGNAIYSNAGLGIDLAPDGVTANDDSVFPYDADSGPNNLQNFPVLTQAITTSNSLRVDGTLRSTPGDGFRIEIYASFSLDPSGFGEGERRVGSVNVSDADNNGVIDFFATATGSFRGQYITATASRLAAGDSSEFSQAVLATCSLVVTNTNDTGFGSLREAINCANSTLNIDRDGQSGADPDPITFAIPGTGPQTITVGNGGLPAITDAVLIDGFSQTAASPNTNPVGQGLNTALQIELAGNAAGTGRHGLRLSAGSGGSTIRGLVINRFSGDGIRVESSGNAIVGNLIGTNPAGSTASGNGVGVRLLGANNAVGGSTAAVRNLISGNIGGAGIFVDNTAATGNVIRGNLIGTNLSGTAALANLSGVALIGAPGNTVGGTENGSANVLAGNKEDGVITFGDPATGNLVQGNFIGTNVAGTAAIANGRQGIYLLSGGNTVGGATAAARNIISGNTAAGILIENATSNVVQGNYIGTNAAGDAALPNVRDGIAVAGGSGNTIGGTAPGAGNVIAGNTLNGIVLYFGIVPNNQSTTVQGNLVGTSPAGAPLGNGFSGVLIVDSSNNTIGGSAAGANTIAFNGSDGVGIISTGSLNTVGNAVLFNSIFSNTGLGIDLGDDGTDVPQDAQSTFGPNRRQNFPTITAVEVVGGSTEIRGTINVEAAPAELRLQLFASAAADVSGYGEGRTYLGETTVNVGAGGTAIFSAVVNELPAGQTFVSATATDVTIRAPATGPANNTSEFSAALGPPTVFTVTTSADSGAGSLREAINAANGDAGADRIEFNIPPTDAGHVYYQDDGIAGQVSLANVMATTAASDASIADSDPDWPHSWYSLALASALPTITEAVVIDAYTQKGASANTNAVGQGLNTVPRVEINGASAGALPSGILNATAGGNTIRGLVINRTQGPKIQFSVQSGGNTVAGNFLGPDISGTKAFPSPAASSQVSFYDALIAISPTEDVIGGTTAGARNLISGNTGPMFRDSGVFSEGGDRILGNLIGTDRSGTLALGNERGIYTGFSGGAVIGGAEAAAANVISGNIDVGIEPLGKTVVQNNWIGLDAAGVSPLGNGAGIELSSPGGNQIVENRVAYNGVGIRVAANGSQGNLLSRNSIFSNSGLGIDFGFNAYVPNDVPPAADPPDQDAGPNALQNHPILTLVTDLQPGTHIEGTLTSTPNSNFRVEFFANADREELQIAGTLFGQLGEGQTYIGSLDIGTNASGQAAFSVNLPVNLLQLSSGGGQPFVTATATDVTPVNGSPRNNTSQFSPIVPLGGASLLVTNTNDTGIGTLREAMIYAIQLGGYQVVKFDIPANDARHFYYQDDGVAGLVSASKAVVTSAENDAGIFTTGPDAIDPDWPHSWFSIQPTRALPGLPDTVVIDGYSQPGASQNTAPAPQGLNTVLKIELNGGNVPGGTGIHLGSGSGAVAQKVQGLAINGWRTGVFVDFSAADTVAGNFIGSDVSGTIARPNTNGVMVAAVGTVIGGLAPEDRNLISGNSLTGVRVDRFGGTLVLGNLFGTNPSGTAIIGTASNGVVLFGTIQVTVGGDAPGASNVFGLLDGPGGQGITIVSDTQIIQPNSSLVTAQDDNPCFPYSTPDEGLEQTLKDMGEWLDLYNGEVGNNGEENDAAKQYKQDMQNMLDFFAKCRYEYQKQHPNDPNGWWKVGYNLKKNKELVEDLLHPNHSNAATVVAATEPRLAIDLDGDGVTPNDQNDADSGPFGGQNYPVLVSATNIKNGSLIVGTLHSLPSATFEIDLYTNTRLHASGYGPGESHLTTITVTTNSSGNASFQRLWPTAIPAGQFLTSLATQLIDRDNNPATPLVPFETSEYSAGITVRENPWHNKAKALDVKPDGKIVPGDALDVINYLNAFGAGLVPASAQPGVPVYYDTNNDAFVAPNDALDVINFLNAFGAEAEGETPGPLDRSGLPENSPLGRPPDHLANDLLALLALDPGQYGSDRRRS